MHKGLRARLGAVLAGATAAVAAVTLAVPAQAAPPTLYGPIHDKYWSLGGPASYLGQRTTGVLPTAAANGYFADFQGGRILYRDLPNVTQPYVVRGAILGRFFADGAVRGVGYPASDESAGAGATRFSRFEQGSIYWSPTTGAHLVRNGVIGTEWAAQKWENGALGDPTTEEGAADNGGFYQSFQRGAIYVDPPGYFFNNDIGGDAFTIAGAIYTYWANSGYERGPYGYPATDLGTATDCRINGVLGVELGQVFIGPDGDYRSLYLWPGDNTTVHTDSC